MHNVRPVYLDNNATTRMDPAVFEAMRPWFMDHYGNAASNTHVFGWEAREAVDDARERTASLIGARPNEIIFTSGATESVNLALKGAGGYHAAKGKHIITCATEHKAVLDTCHSLSQRGFDLTIIPVDGFGMIDLAALESAIRPDTILLAFMYANNETGLLHPVRAIASCAQKHDILFFCDATQAVGKIPVDVDLDGMDMMAFSAHKIHGPKGSGALYVRRRPQLVHLVAQMDGGGHERGFRSGTLNVPGIVGLGAACEMCRDRMDEDGRRITLLRDRLESSLLSIPGTALNGHPSSRLHNVTNISFRDVEGQALVLALSNHVAVSTGSACSSVLQEPSHVLKAMGVEDDLARSSIRFSLGRFTTNDDITYVIEKVRYVIADFQKSDPN
jgi:cysteine desulfurase